jgi:hypothetical protein
LAVTHWVPRSFRQEGVRNAEFSRKRRKPYAETTEASGKCGFEEAAERLPLQELYAEPADPSAARRRFATTFVRASRGRVEASLFSMVFAEDGRWLADHLWTPQVWDHLKPGDGVEFHASVVPYRRKDGSEGFTLGGISGLIVRGGAEPAAE